MRCYKCDGVIRDNCFEQNPDGSTAHLNACPPSRVVRFPKPPEKRAPESSGRFMLFELAEERHETRLTLFGGRGVPD